MGVKRALLASAECFKHSLFLISPLQGKTGGFLLQNSFAVFSQIFDLHFSSMSVFLYLITTILCSCFCCEIVHVARTEWFPVILK